MCKSTLHGFLHALPKCEHHMHLEGALTPTLLFRLAAKNSITLPDRPWYGSAEKLQARYDEKFDSLQDFLDIHFANMAVLIHESDFHDLAWDYFQDAHSGGVHHAEVFLDPQSHTSRNVDISTVISGFSSAAKRAESGLGMSTRLIMCFLRHLPVDSAMATLRSAEARITDGTIHGVGLSSTEVGFPPELFRDVFMAAEKQGLRRTAHAGEEGDVSYITGALTALHAERIDHGVRIVEDKALMKSIAAAGIMLTVCPLSNYYLKVVTSVAELPIRQFLDMGLQFSLNSDDPAYFGGGALNNYCAVQEAFDLKIEDWRKIAASAINGSWIDIDRKEQLLKKLDDTISLYIKAS